MSYFEFSRARARDLRAEDDQCQEYAAWFAQQSVQRFRTAFDYCDEVYDLAIPLSGMVMADIQAALAEIRALEIEMSDLVVVYKSTPAILGHFASALAEMQKLCVSKRALLEELSHWLGKPLTASPVTLSSCNNDEADSLLIDIMTRDCASKLAVAREKGRGGWHRPEECSMEQLHQMLKDALSAEDMRDVMIVAGMIHVRRKEDDALQAVRNAGR